MHMQRPVLPPRAPLGADILTGTQLKGDGFHCLYNHVSDSTHADSLYIKDAYVWMENDCFRGNH